MGFRVTPSFSRGGKRLGPLLVPGRWEAGRAGAGEVSPYRSTGLQSGGRAVEVKTRWVQSGSLQMLARGSL